MLRKLSVILALVTLFLTFVFVLGVFAAIFKWVDQPIATLVADISFPAIFGVVALLLVSLFLEGVMEGISRRRAERKEESRKREVKKLHDKISSMKSKVVAVEEELSSMRDNANAAGSGVAHVKEKIAEIQDDVELAKVPQGVGAKDLVQEFEEQKELLRNQLLDLIDECNALEKEKEESGELRKKQDAEFKGNIEGKLEEYTKIHKQPPPELDGEGKIKFLEKLAAKVDLLEQQTNKIHSKEMKDEIRNSIKVEKSRITKTVETLKAVRLPPGGGGSDPEPPGPLDSSIMKESGSGRNPEPPGPLDSSIMKESGPLQFD